MRSRLLDATIGCLVELGYARTTTVEIAKRAGASRGAQLHHFPTKAELVTRAVEHLFERRMEEFRRAFAALPAEVDRAAAAVDLLWSMLSSPTAYAALELHTAARTDPELRQALSPVDARFSEHVRQTFRELFPAPAEPNPLFDLAPAVTFAVLGWLANQKTLHGQEPEYRIMSERMIDLLKHLAPLAIPSAVR